MVFRLQWKDNVLNVNQVCQFLMEQNQSVYYANQIVLLVKNGQHYVHRVYLVINYMIINVLKIKFLTTHLIYLPYC